MTSGGNPQSKPDFSMPILMAAVLILCLLMGMWEVALLPLVLGIVMTHVEIKESREGEG